MRITEIKGVGEKSAELLKKIEIETVEDALLYFPRTYIQFPEMKAVCEAVEGETAAIIGKVLSVPVVKKVRSMQITVTYVGDSTKKLKKRW